MAITLGAILFLIVGIGLIVLAGYLPDLLEHRARQSAARPKNDKLKMQAMRLIAEIETADRDLPVLTVEQRDRAQRILRAYYGKEIGPT